MRPLKLALLGSLALSTALSSGCAKSKATAPDEPPATTPDEPVPTDSTPNPTTTTPPATAKYAGVYSANAPLDFTQKGALPGIASPALAALTLADTNPGTAIVNFAEAAGVTVPGGSTVGTLIGSYLDTQLGSLLPPDVLQALDVLGSIAQISQTGVLKNKITVHTPKADKTVAVELEVLGAGFDFIDINGQSKHVDTTVPAASAAAAKTSLIATLTPRSNAPVADADLALSGGSVTVPMGDFLMQAVGTLVLQPKYGVSTIQEAFTEIMRQPCADVGTAVAMFVNGNLGINILTPSVGDSICTAAVTLAATQLTDQISSIKLEHVTITNGRVVLYDTSSAKPTIDNQSDRLAEGTWTWHLGSADVVSTLAGARTGVAN